MTRIFLIGYPGNVGGACTEAWHTLRLWKEGGMDVHVIPTWGQDAAWEAKLDSIGIPTHHVPRREIESFDLLQDCIAVGMCNDNFFTVVGQLRAHGCRLVWVNCMTWPFDAERVIYEKHGLFDAYVFQSEFQRGILDEHLAKYGYDSSRGHLIRGAFFADEWDFAPRPHRADEPFVVGRLARAAPDKWSPELWTTYARIGYRPLEARVMGWRPKLKRVCGRPPEWAECLNVDACDVPSFMHSLHCLVTINGGALENWPRVGLEAMAAGVPIVTENRWGWREMVVHGETGFLGDTNEEIARYATELAHNERRRLEIARAGRQHVERLAEPQRLWSKWQRLFEELGAGGRNSSASVVHGRSSVAGPLGQFGPENGQVGATTERTTSSPDGMTGVLLNWKRPENVFRILENWRAGGIVREAIVWNNNPDMRVVHEWAKVINASQDFGMYTRFAAACLGGQECILIQDDDLELPRASLEKLYAAWREDPDVIHGVFGRAPKPDGSYGRGIDGNAEVPVVLTRALLARRAYAAQFFLDAGRFDGIQHSSRPPGNGEDIIFSYCVMRASGRPNRVHEVQIDELPARHALHARNWRAHVAHRTRLLRACQAWREESELGADVENSDWSLVIRH